MPGGNHNMEELSIYWAQVIPFSSAMFQKNNECNGYYTYVLGQIFVT